MRDVLLAAGLALGLTLGLLSCSDSSTGIPSPPEPVGIGPAGGTVSSPDGQARLVVPPNALSDMVAMTITPVGTPPAGAVGTVYDIRPSGTQLSPPATLTLTYDPSALPSGVEPGDLAIGTHMNGAWVELATTHGAGTPTLSAPVSHFSLFGAVPTGAVGPAACPELALSSAAAAPLREIEVTGVPDHFAEFLGGEVIDLAGEERLVAFVSRSDDGRVFLEVPVHPTGAIEGGPVHLRMIDEEGRACQGLLFTIEPLPAAPGAFQLYFEAVQELIAVQAEALGTTPAALQAADPDTVPDHLFPWVMAQGLADHPENANSMRAVAAREAPFTSEETAESWALLDALTARSGVAHRLRDLTAAHVALAVPAPPAFPGGDVLPPSSGAACTGPFYNPDAFTLSRWMDLSATSSIALSPEVVGYLDAAGFLLNASMVLAAAGTGGAVAKARIGAAGVLGNLGLFVSKAGMEAMEGLLPSILVSLDFEYGPAVFLEDDEVTTGNWSEAMLTTRSRGWSADRAILDGLLQTAGGVATKKGAQWFSKRTFIPEGPARELADGFNALIADTWLQELLQQKGGQSGVVHFPGCDFGPTDISAEEWSEAEIVGDSDLVASIRGHGSYEVWMDGEVFLLVRSRAGAFGLWGTVTAARPIEVLRLEVEIIPDEQVVEPGQVVSFEARVTNANDPSVQWTISPTSHSLEVVGGDGGGTVRVHTSGDPDQLPAVLTARSTATGPMRPLALPARTANALLHTGAFILEPGGACVEPGNALQFELRDPRPPPVAVSAAGREEDAAASPEPGPGPQRSGHLAAVWEASEGSITQQGLFTAPGTPGLVTVTARRGDREERALVRVAENCRCWWIASIDGGFSGTATGDVAYFFRQGSDLVVSVSLRMVDEPTPHIDVIAVNGEPVLLPDFETASGLPSVSIGNVPPAPGSDGGFWFTADPETDAPTGLLDVFKNEGRLFEGRTQGTAFALALQGDNVVILGGVLDLHFRADQHPSQLEVPTSYCKVEG